MRFFLECLSDFQDNIYTHGTAQTVFIRAVTPPPPPFISGCLEQADFPAPQVTYHSGLPDGKESKQVVNSEKRKLRQLDKFPRLANFKKFLSEGQVRI